MADSEYREYLILFISIYLLYVFSFLYSTKKKDKILINTASSGLFILPYSLYRTSFAHISVIKASRALRSSIRYAHPRSGARVTKVPLLT